MIKAMACIIKTMKCVNMIHRHVMLIMVYAWQKILITAHRTDV